METVILFSMVCAATVLANGTLFVLSGLYLSRKLSQARKEEDEFRAEQAQKLTDYLRAAQAEAKEDTGFAAGWKRGGGTTQ